MSKHILIIEDDLVLLQLMGMILRKQGYRISEARNGKEAMHALKTQGFDLILTDLMLPHSSGLDLLSRIKKDSRHSKTPVMIISAINNEDILLDGFHIGADDYLPKPFAPDELISKISKLLATAVS